MGFELIRKNGKTSPLIICDICKKPILKANLGVITWVNPNKGEKILFKVVHKGECDIHKDDLSMELRHYFAYLDVNCIRETREEDRSSLEFLEEM